MMLCVPQNAHQNIIDESALYILHLVAGLVF